MIKVSLKLRIGTHYNCYVSKVGLVRLEVLCSAHPLPN